MKQFDKTDPTKIFLFTTNYKPDRTKPNMADGSSRSWLQKPPCHLEESQQISQTNNCLFYFFSLVMNSHVYTPVNHHEDMLQQVTL